MAIFAAIQARADVPSIISLVTNGLFEPFGVAVDADNNFYLSDNSHRVFKYVYDNGTLTALAGQQAISGTNNGPGFLAQMYSPKGVALYGGGLVVADSGNHWLRFVTLTGNRIEVVTNFAGIPNLNQPGVASAVPVPALQARFNNPLGLVVSDTNLFIADSKNNAIRRLYPNPSGDGYLVATLQVSFVDPVSGFFEPSTLAFGDNGVLYVADTRNHLVRQLFPQADGSYAAYGLAGSVHQVAGTNDAYFAREGQFNMPSGLLWMGGNIGLLVADSGNQTIRDVYQDQDLTDFFGSNVWSLASYAGQPKSAGLKDGFVNAALFKNPQQMAKDQSGGMLIIDSGNNALRRIQIEAQKPAMSDPVLGYVTFVTNNLGLITSKLISFSDHTFYDDAILAVIGEEQSVLYTYGNTPGLNETDTIPTPKAGIGESAPFYADGMFPEEVPQSLITAKPDVTLKAISVQEGRRPSSVVKARVRFKVASPQIVGDNPLSLTLLNPTADADIWYTLDNLDADGNVPQTNRFGPYRSGDALQLLISSNVTLKVQAVRPNYLNSEVVTKSLSATNFAANRISFGFASGEASSEFVAAPGQKFYAPITLSLLSGQTIYSMQFNTRVASIDGAPKVPASSITFTSMLWKPLEGVNPPVYVRIDPMMVLYGIITNVYTDNYIETNITWASNVYTVQVTNSVVTNIAVLTNIDYVTNYVDLGYITNYMTRTNDVATGQYQIITNSSIDGTVMSYYYVSSATNIYYLSITNSSTDLGWATNWYQVTNFNVQTYSYTNYSYDITETNLVLVNTNVENGDLNGLDWDPSSQLLMAGWFERATMTNLYNTRKQDLVTYSMAHNHMYSSSAGKVILGSFIFDVPGTATNGSEYLLQIGRPSATSDGIDTDAYIDTPTNGSLTIGAINSIKHVSIGQIKYVVGDSSPFRWFNAGDFGDGSILNSDLMDLYQAVAYDFNVPMTGSDFFDAMDSASNIPLADSYNGSDYLINDMKLGDGVLGVDDIYVNYRRGLDPTLKWYVRYWSNGARVAEETENKFRGSRTSLPPTSNSNTVAKAPAKAAKIKLSTAKPTVCFAAGEIQGEPGKIVSVPIEARITGPYPIRVLLLNLNVVPVNGAPALEENVTFEPAEELGSPLIADSATPGNYSATWLNSKVAGLWGDAVVGRLKFKVPASASSAACYQIVFSKASASPSGVGTFPQSLQNGIVKMTAVPLVTWNDGISDVWRLRYFGSLTESSSAANADPDGDGISNWNEYVAGTHPLDANSALRVQSRLDKSSLNADGQPSVILNWSSVEGRNYSVETVSSLNDTQWTPVADVVGTGEALEYKDASGSTAEGKYYRVRVTQ